MIARAGNEAPQGALNRIRTRRSTGGLYTELKVFAIVIHTFGVALTPYLPYTDTMDDLLKDIYNILSKTRPLVPYTIVSNEEWVAVNNYLPPEKRWANADISHRPTLLFAGHWVTPYG